MVERTGTPAVRNVPTPPCSFLRISRSIDLIPAHALHISTTYDVTLRSPASLTTVMWRSQRITLLAECPRAPAAQYGSIGLTRKKSSRGCESCPRYLVGTTLLPVAPLSHFTRIRDCWRAINTVITYRCEVGKYSHDAFRRPLITLPLPTTHRWCFQMTPGN